MIVHRFFFYLTFLTTVTASSGCQYFSAGLDKAGATLAKQTNEYCAWPYHRRLSLYILVNGELEPSGHVITVECRGDAEIEAQLALLEAFETEIN